MIEHARHRGVRLAHRDLGLPDLRKPRRQRLRHLQRQRLDQETAVPGDDLLDHRKGDAVIDGVLDGIFFQRPAGLDGQLPPSEVRTWLREHLVGGRHDELKKAVLGRNCYDCVSALNRNHMRWAWCSLFWVAFSDVYVRLCSMGIFTDWRII